MKDSYKNTMGLIAAASLPPSTGAWAEPHDPCEWPDNQPAEWISKDGKTAWLVIAANCWAEPANPKQCTYACSMHEFRFVTASEESNGKGKGSYLYIRQN